MMMLRHALAVQACLAWRDSWETRRGLASRRAGKMITVLHLGNHQIFRVCTAVDRRIPVSTGTERALMPRLRIRVTDRNRDLRRLAPAQ